MIISEWGDLLQCSTCGISKVIWGNVGQTGHSYEQYDNFFRVERKRTALRILKYLKKYTEGNLLLDIGCAGGEFVVCALAHGFDAYGLEPNNNFARQAKIILGNRILNDSIENFVPSVKYDVVLLLDVLEHTKSPAMVIKKVHYLMKKHGILVLKSPDTRIYFKKPYWKKYLINMYLNEYPLPIAHHLWQCTPQGVSTLLKYSGFEILKCYSVINPKELTAIGSHNKRLFMKFLRSTLAILGSPQNTIFFALKR